MTERSDYIPPFKYTVVFDYILFDWTNEGLDPGKKFSTSPRLPVHYRCKTAGERWSIENWRFSRRIKPLSDHLDKKPWCGFRLALSDSLCRVKDHSSGPVQSQNVFELSFQRSWKRSLLKNKMSIRAAPLGRLNYSKLSRSGIQLVMELGSGFLYYQF